MSLQGEITTVTHWAEKWIALVKAHERLLIVLLVLAFGYHAYGSWLNYDAARKDAQVAALTQTVAQDKTTEANLAITAATAASDAKVALDASRAANASLTQALQQIQGNLKRQQTVDDQSNLPTLAARMVTLVPNSQISDVTVGSTGLTLDAAISHLTVSQLETVPALQGELKDETQIAAADQTALTAASTAVVACQADNAALKTTVVDQDKKFTAEVQDAKVREKKAFRKGFKWGAVAGFIGGLFVHVAIP